MRNIINKLLGVFMALVCVVSIISYTPANAKNSNFYTNADQYVADFILGQYKTPDGQNVSMINFSGNPITYEFTYKKISEGIIDKKWLIVGSVFWKNTKNCLDSDFVDLVNWEQIMYESLIMNWLSYEYDSDDYESEFAKTSAKYVFKLQKSIYGDNVEVKDINKIKPGDAKKKMKENFFDKNETWNKIAKGEDIASKVFDAGMEVEEATKRIADICAAKETCESRLVFLNEVKNVTSNQHLKDAIDVVNKKIESVKIENYAGEYGYSIAKLVCKEVCDKILSDIKKTAGISGPLDVIDIGRDGLNWLFNTDNASTATVKMTILYTINSDFTTAYTNIRSKYQKDSSEENALLFTNAFLAYVNYQAYASNETREYVDSCLTDSMFAKIKKIFTSKDEDLKNDLYGMLDSNISVCSYWNKIVRDKYDTFENINKNLMKWYYDEDSSEELNIPDDAVEYNGHYYYLYKSGEAGNFTEAKQYCEDKLGYLATITSKEENDFLYKYMKDARCEYASFGLYEGGEHNYWKWINNEDYIYSNWSDDIFDDGGSNRCAQFSKEQTDGKWIVEEENQDDTSSNYVFICEWGEYTYGFADDIKEKSAKRDIVLTLDASGSMDGTPMEETKKASEKFVETILGKEANIGVVSYDGTSNIMSPLASNKAYLENTVNGLKAGGGTNIEEGLSEAYNMLKDGSAEKKIIVLMSDGEPNEGKQGEELIEYANELKKEGALIYTLGFFENLSTNKSEAQLLMEKIASDGCHYEVASADDLVFFFNDMADQINGQKYIYVRIACPVEVSVKHNGQTLNSKEGKFNGRTDFGTLTIEENTDNQQQEETSNEQTDSQSDSIFGLDDSSIDHTNNQSEDNKVKVLRLKEGEDYDVEIEGTGSGKMNYTIGFMDEKGNYNDLRKFENISITRKTKIDTVAKRADESILNIDEDGDGKYEKVLSATFNGVGKEVKQSKVTYYVVATGAIVFIGLLIFIFVKVKRRKRNV